MLYFSFPGFVQEEETGAEQEKQKVKHDSAPAPSPLSFSAEKIEKYRQSREFDYSPGDPEENWWTTFKRYVSLKWQSLMNWIFGRLETSGIWIFLMEAIPYLLLCSFLVFIVWLFQKLDPVASFLSTPEGGKVVLHEEEKIVRNEDIRSLIDAAVGEENYRLATRYYYLLILQQLSNNGYIDYAFSKTDTDYLAEIERDDLKNHFRKLTRIYDFIWYGNFGVGKEDFMKISRDFRKMEQLIPEHGKI